MNPNIGGISRDMHAGKREESIKGRGRKPNNKSVVMGLLARHGEKMPVSKIVARAIPTTSSSLLK
ncbi:MAG TPA: hypothetical protein VHY22_00035 [Chthoniobacteraceae bacterium]|jgi:hypothetical protein|nr:hypothetical protein [Chthoniobacteraceae bacterium]